MKKSRFTEEQIALALRQAERGGTDPGGVPEDGALGADVLPVEEEIRRDGRGGGAPFEAAGGGESEAEAAGGGPEPGQGDAAGRSAGKTLTPDRRRTQIRRAQHAYGVSERRTCRPPGVLIHARATQRYESVADDQAILKKRIHEIAQMHMTWGYARIWVKLRREGWPINRKRVYRLYRHEGLCVGRKRPRRHRSSVTRPERTTATRPNESWSMDFMADELFDGRRFRLFTLVDDFTRESLVIDVSPRLNGDRVAEALDRVGRVHGALPAKIRVDNGTEFTGKRLDQWAYLSGVKLDFSRRGKPTDNGLIEAFNGRLRAECLNEHWFLSLEAAPEKVEAWRRHYNEERPHSALGNLAPREFAASFGQAREAG